MRPLLAGILAAAVTAIPAAALAQAPYPDTTPRQLRNQYGYDTGGYYERDSKAVPFGSRAWWELKTKDAAD